MPTPLPGSSLSRHQAQAVFDRSLLPLPSDFYRKELGELRRPDRKGWSSPMSGCPFHASESKKSFFVKLDSGGFFCHGCGAKGGDVIDFVRLRDRMDFKTAARAVGALRDEPSDARARERIALERKQREQARAREEERTEDERRNRIQLRDDLHFANRLIVQVSEDLRSDPGNDALWQCLQLAVECCQLDEQAYVSAAGLGVSRGL